MPTTLLMFLQTRQEELLDREPWIVPVLVHQEIGVTFRKIAYHHGDVLPIQITIRTVKTHAKTIIIIDVPKMENQLKNTRGVDIIITHNSSCGKVMFSQAPMSHSVHKRGGYAWSQVPSR